MKFDKHEINNYGNNDIGIGKSGNSNNKGINININDDGKNTKFFFRGTATLLSAFAYRHLSLSVYLGFWVLAFWSSFFFLLSIVCSVFRLLELCVLVSAVIRVFVFSCVSMVYVLCSDSLYVYKYT